MSRKRSYNNSMKGNDSSLTHMDKRQEIPTSVRLPPELRTKVEQLATKNRRSINAQILWIIEHYEEQKEVNKEQQ